MRHSRSSNFHHVTDNISTLKWGKDNGRATRSFRCISEAIGKVLKNSPCMCVYVILEHVLLGAFPRLLERF